MTNSNVIVYGSGLFNSTKGDFSPKQQLLQMINSQFDTVILWSLHIDAVGTLIFNDTPLVKEGTALPALLSLVPYMEQMRSKSKMKNLLFSIGGWDCNDHQNMIALWSNDTTRTQLQKNFTVLVQTLDINGIDHDLEQHYSQDFQDIVVELTVWLHAELNVFTTYCPYTNSGFWLDCLAAVYGKLNEQPVKWFNLQCYAGGAGNTPSQWVNYVKDYSGRTGVTDVNNFIMPGYWAYTSGFSTSCPCDFESTFKEISVQGGFLWNSDSVFQNNNTANCRGAAMDMEAYSSAMKAGIAA